MSPTTQDALTIWQTGVDAVDSERLVKGVARCTSDSIELGNVRLAAEDVDRVLVVGAGKAGAGMASALVAIFGERFGPTRRLEGWVNVPEGCERELDYVRLHPARPAGVNEPTEAGCQGTRQMLNLVESAGPKDLCICVLSGGGSALMPAPTAGIRLEDKVAVTRHLSAAGANIDQLNTVRKQLSDVKGGGLLRVCRAGTLVTLIISDVLGDPLDVIASGPTVPNTTGPQDALEVLDQFGTRQAGISAHVFEVLQAKVVEGQPTSTFQAHNLVIGNNSTAVQAAAAQAASLGYKVDSVSASASEGRVEEVAETISAWIRAHRDQRTRCCLVSGGEPTVHLAPAEIRGRGGRNQQLVLDLLQRLAQDAGGSGIVVLSGGTDGEDGPTDAAGAVADAEILAAAQSRGLDAADYLSRNDAYHFFQPLGALIKTGPTHTNVCDLRVVLIDSKPT